MDTWSMPCQRYQVFLQEEVSIFVEFHTYRGTVISFIVRLMLRGDTEEHCIVRFDTAHGLPHRDTVNSKGMLLRKDWLIGMSFSDALDYAISNIKENYETYIQEFHREL